jgi:hypothetical protein
MALECQKELAPCHQYYNTLPKTVLAKRQLDEFQLDCDGSSRLGKDRTWVKLLRHNSYHRSR